MIEWTRKQEELRSILAGPCTHVGAYGGSRSGKTLMFCYATIVRALKANGSRHAVVRNIARDAKSKIGMDTLPRIHSMTGLSPDYDKTGGRYVYPNGSEIHLLGLDDAGDRHSRILGSEYSTLLFDEATEIPYESTVIARTRLAQKNCLAKKSYYAFNPPTRAHWLHRLFVEKLDPVDMRPLHRPDDYILCKLDPKDNTANLDPDYLLSLDSLPARQRQRFRDGEWGSPVEGVLWKVQWIEDNRIQKIVEEIEETVVGVDPACGGGCENGIVAISLGSSGHQYVVGDRSSRGTPAEWALAVTTLYRETGASRVIAEANQGGEMVRSNIQQADPSVRVELVHAGQSKRLRAEPVAALAERGLLHHVGKFLELEDQLVSWAPGSDSPDRLDAMVHASAALSPGNLVRPRVAGGEDRQSISDAIEDDRLWSNL